MNQSAKFQYENLSFVVKIMKLTQSLNIEKQPLKVTMRKLLRIKFLSIQNRKTRI